MHFGEVPSVAGWIPFRAGAREAIVSAAPQLVGPGAQDRIHPVYTGKLAQAVMQRRSCREPSEVGVGDHQPASGFLAEHR